MASAKNVVLYTTLTTSKRRERDDGVVGLLVVTNFKLSFLTGNNDQQNITYQGNLFLNCNDVTLQNIDCIHQIVDRKKRLINPYSKISSRLEGLQIVCKVIVSGPTQNLLRPTEPYRNFFSLLHRISEC